MKIISFLQIHFSLDDQSKLKTKLLCMVQYNKQAVDILPYVTAQCTP
jgi:hypothetical protein